MIITTIKASSEAGIKILSGLRNRFQTADSQCRQDVTEIIYNIKTRGDDALLEYIRKFDSPNLSPQQLRVSKAELIAAYNQVDDDFRQALRLAIKRIYHFHEHEKEDSFMITREDGVITGRLVRPLDAAGLYVPAGQGGKTPLVSSVLMNGIPADIAGVSRRVMLSPSDQHGQINPILLVAAQEIGITEIYKAGSGWAIAALAFGTETIPMVDVIVGPGNQYVAEAKSQVANRVRIDMVAGPSEVLIIADQTADPDFIAADMLAQAEHDPMALALCITTSTDLAARVVSSINKQLPQLARQDIARQSLKKRGALLLVDNLEQAMSHANEIAPEHLELMIVEPFSWLGRVKHAGAIFLGSYSPEAAGDYLAGPNHVLPTMGTARFSSPLGVEVFTKKSSLISYSQKGLLADSCYIQKLADLEGLSGHSRSVIVREEKSLAKKVIAKDRHK